MLGIFLDSETNGLNPHKHAILELAYKIVDVVSGQVEAVYESIIHQPLEEWEKSEPESLKINGFTWEEIEKGKPAYEVARETIETFERFGVQRKSAVFICQNPSFDRAFFSQLIDPDLQEALGWPYHWLDLASMYWAEKVRQGRNGEALFPWETGVSKDIIATVCNLSPEGKPHRAMNGVNHLLLCYEAVVGFAG